MVPYCNFVTVAQLLVGSSLIKLVDRHSRQPPENIAGLAASAPSLPPRAFRLTKLEPQVQAKVAI